MAKKYVIGLTSFGLTPINTQYVFISFLIVQLLTKLIFISKTNHCIVYLWTSGKKYFLAEYRPMTLGKKRGG